MTETTKKAIETSFSMKFQHEKKDEKGEVVKKDGKPVMEDDKERTEIKFSLDFSNLKPEDILVYATREVTRIVNSEIRDGKRKLEDVKGKTLVVPKFEAGQRGKGKVTEEIALQKLAETYGISIEALQKKMMEMKGAAK